ncbi:uncharacterized protein LOC143209708 [Lasioglossum baleicum]|uniref:uncharacterized protein LOC143209708 n=1 Tax=Lasioglossum baleicum TaxID=434251 RepID=UPI003FCC8F97
MYNEEDVTQDHVLTLYKWPARKQGGRQERRTAGSHDSPTPRGRCSAMSSSLVVGGIKVSGDRDPKISSARTTLHAAWAIVLRTVSGACASSRSSAPTPPETYEKLLHLIR